MKIFKTYYIAILLTFLTAISKGQSVSVGATETCLTPCGDYSIARDPNVDVHFESGKVVYTWLEQDIPVSGSNRDVYCQIYDKDLVPLTSKFRLNSYTLFDQSNAVVKINQEDRTVAVAWTSTHGTDNDIYVKKFSLDITDPASVLLTNEVLVPETNLGVQVIPKLAFDYVRNEVIVAWRDDSGRDTLNASGTPIGGSGLYARRVNYTSMTPVGSEFKLNQQSKNNQGFGDIEISPYTGELIVVYQSQERGNNDIHLRKFTRNTDGSFTGNNYIRVNSNAGSMNDEQWRSYMTLNRSNGNLIVSFNSDYQDGDGRGVYFKVYDKNGNVVKDETCGSGTVTAGPQTGLRILWDERSGGLMCFYLAGSGSSTTLKYQLFDNSFNIVGSEMPAIGSATVNWYDGAYYTAYSQAFRKFYLAYSVYSGTNSVAKARPYTYTAPGSVTLPSVSTDPDKNWTQTTVYDEYGNVVSESKSYFDNLGRGKQGQTRNLEENKILVNEKVYDQFGKAVIATLPAPIDAAGFSYTSRFIAANTSCGSPAANCNPYDYNSFNTASTINNPGTVGNLSPLGKYYSASSSESANGITGFPYTRVDYNDNTPGGVLRVAQAGEALRMGSGNEKEIITLPLTNELDAHYRLLRNSITGYTTASLSGQGYKTLIIDENNNENYVFSDKSGNTIATATGSGSANLAGTGYTSVSPTISSATIGYCTYYLTLNASGTCNYINIKLKSAADIEVKNTSTGNVSNSLPQAINTVFYIRSRSPFSVEYDLCDNYGDHVVVNSVKGFDTPSYDVYVKDLSAFSISNTNAGQTLEVTDLRSGAVAYNGAVSGYTKPAAIGIYRFRVKDAPFAADYNNARVTINNSITYHNLAYSFYDDAGRPVKSIAPKGIVFSSTGLSSQKYLSTLVYNTIGQVISSENVDEGLTYYAYRSDGKLRFSENAKQRGNNKFSYLSYNSNGELVETGEYQGTAIVFAQGHSGSNTTNGVLTILEDVSDGGGLGAISCNCRKEISRFEYHKPSSNPSDRTCRYTQGRLASSANETGTIWYSYDELGRVEWTVQSVINMGGPGNHLLKTVDYKYDLSGSLLQVIYQKKTTSERFEHLYTYNRNKSLVKVETRDGSKGYQQEAVYKYYLHGALKRTELADNLQGIDYTYTVNGWLKGINHPSLEENADPGKDGKSGSLFAKDVFGMAFQYYANDYSSAAATFTNTSLPTDFSNQYSQNIQAMKWQVRGNGMGTGNADMLMYGFKYDEKNQLTEARFGTVTNTSQSTFNTSADAQSGKFNVYNLVYDLNGNMTSMKTNGSGGTVYDDFTYEISGLSGTPENSTPVNNRLAGVKAGISYYRTYGYNAIGQMTSEVRSGNTNTVEYDSYGNVTSSTIASVGGTNFYYNERGQRTKKESKDGAGAVTYTTWYIRDIAGNVLSIYDNNGHSLQQTEIPIYGIERLGTYYKSSTDYIYELKDHLGNIRASVARAKVSGVADIRSWSDYHPFGNILQGREQVLAQGKRYDYQADNSEKDGETGWNSFELRMYDSRIARWMSPDPYGVNWSPYMAMGNNPVNMVDPDGGTEGGPTSDGGGGSSGNFDPGNPGAAYANAYYSSNGFTIGMIFTGPLTNEIPNWKGGKSSLTMLFGRTWNGQLAQIGPISGTMSGSASMMGFGFGSNASGAMAGSVGAGYGNLHEGGQTWYYLWKHESDGTNPRDMGSPGHSMIWNPYTNKVYEINHANQGADEPDGLALWLDFNPKTYKSIHFVWDLSEKNKDAKFGRDAFWNYRGGRVHVDLFPVYVPKPAKAEKFFESRNGLKWRYNLLLRNCKDYIVKGLRIGGASIKQGGILPGIWKNSEKVDSWDSLDDVPTQPLKQ